MGTSSSPAQLAAKLHKAATVIPRAQRVANEQSARAIKPIWYGQAGIRQGSVIAKRKVSIRDTTRGTKNVVTLLAWQGPVHLIEGNTGRHIIAARRLATRGGARKLTNQLSMGASLNAAFGGRGGNSGAFGSLRKAPKSGNAKRALTIGPNLRPYAFHPGTTGRRFWDSNKASARVIARTVYRQAALPSILREAGLS